jgi:hypothetical protein
VEDPQDLLVTLAYIAVDSTESAACSHALRCISRQWFSHTDLAAQVMTFIVRGICSKSYLSQAGELSENSLISEIFF